MNTASDFRHHFPQDVVDHLTTLRRDLHRFPELAFGEHKTAARLMGALQSVNPVEIRPVAGTGIVARVAGRDRTAPLVAIRGDIDALPIDEETGFDFASEHAGIMHACGHDVHATWTVGAAHLLATHPAHGDVLVVLQPAEEIGQGARAVLASGALDDVRAIFGAHVDRRFPVGQVVAQTGPLAASADMFTIEIRGQGGHGARPHETRDPIVAGAAIVTALQTLISRRLNPATPGVVTIGSFQSGTASNVIPETARLTGTVRALDPDTRRRLHEDLDSTAAGIAAAYAVEAVVTIEDGTPPIVNQSEPVSWAREAITALLGPNAITPLGTVNMGGEDFAYYLEQIPGCFLRIGARESGSSFIPAHTPKFYAAESSIFVGALVLAESARRASASIAAGG